MVPIARPFRNLTLDQWENLAIGALIAFYVIQVLLDVAWGNTLGHLSIDFASFWSAGFIANHYGYGRVYDLGLMRQIQEPLWPRSAGAAALFRVLPTAYLPVFLLPFQLLSFLEPVPASWLWMFLNLLILVAYLQYFAIRITGRGAQPRLLVMLMISAAVFSNLFTGQVNVWLMICAGEFMLAVMAGRRFQSGLWLGGLLLKPQCLILLVPALLLQRAFKIIGGLAVSATAILGTSLALAGADGLLQVARMWLGFAAGLPTNDPQLMMNWRMVGLHLGALTTAPLGWTIAILGLSITVFATLYLWRLRLLPSSPLYPIALTGTLAATGVVAWHSHVHMAMILLPSLVYLHLKHPSLLGRRLDWWVFLPAFVYVARFMLAGLMQAGVFPSVGGVLDFLAGAGLFAVNTYLLCWAVGQSRLQTTAATAPQ